MPGTADNNHHEERAKDTPYKNGRKLAPGERGDEKTLFVYIKKNEMDKRTLSGFEAKGHSTVHIH